MSNFQAYFVNFLRRTGLFTNATREIRNMVWGISIGLASQILTFLIMLLLGYTTIHGFNTGIAARTQLNDDFKMSVCAAVLEELIFRLVLYGLLMVIAWKLSELISARTRISSISARQAGTVMIIFVVAFVFGQFHYINEIEHPGSYSNWFQIVWVLSAGGLVLTFSRAVSGSIWMPMVIHFIWDFGLGLLNPDGASNHLLNTQIAGPAWVHVDGILVQGLLTIIAGIGIAFFWKKQTHLAV